MASLSVFLLQFFDRQFFSATLSGEFLEYQIKNSRMRAEASGSFYRVVLVVLVALVVLVVLIVLVVAL